MGYLPPPVIGGILKNLELIIWSGQMGKSKASEQDCQEIQSRGFTKQLIEILRKAKKENWCTYLKAIESKNLSEFENFADVMWSGLPCSSISLEENMVVKLMLNWDLSLAIAGIMSVITNRPAKVSGAALSISGRFGESKILTWWWTAN